MNPEYWRKQTPETPLFPALQWNRPENRMYAGKLLIIGGHKQGFSAPAAAYSEALKAGVGAARVLLPDALERTVSKLFPEAEYAPSTPIGSFGLNALGEILPATAWADGALLAGDFGKNSETTIMLDGLLRKYSGALTLSDDGIAYALTQAADVVQRPSTTLVMTFGELQKLISAAQFPQALTSDMDMLRFIDLLHTLSLAWEANIVAEREGVAYVAVRGEVGSTPTKRSTVQIAAHASVWWLQNPSKPFEALTTSLVD